RQHRRSRVGADERFGAGPVGPAGDQRLPRRRSRSGLPPRGRRDDLRAARGQRIRCPTPSWPTESGDLMSVSLLRTAEAWWVKTPAGAARVDTAATTTADLLRDRAAIDAAPAAGEIVPVETLDLRAPVTAPCRVVAQMTNYASHVKDSGMD